MVRLSVWHDNQPRKIAIRDAIRFELETQQSTLVQKRLRIEMDLHADIAMQTCTQEVRSAIEMVLGLAIDRSPRDGVLSIIGCLTERGIELEIADDGDELKLPRFAAVRVSEWGRLVPAPRTPATVCCVGTPCPQGGMAWTMVLQRSQSAAKAA
jgi:hypothetical protein